MFGIRLVRFFGNPTKVFDFGLILLKFRINSVNLVHVFGSFFLKNRLPNRKMKFFKKNLPNQTELLTKLTKFRFGSVQNPRPSFIHRRGLSSYMIRTTHKTIH